MSDDSPALRSGLHPAEIIEGYEKALGKALTWLEEMVSATRSRSPSVSR